jgi:spore maturation protein CgeB
VPATLEKTGMNVFHINSATATLESFRRDIEEFKPELIFGFIQNARQVMKIAGFLNEYHPAAVINWYLEDPNLILDPDDPGINIIEASASFDMWFSQDSKMIPFWKTRAAFMPPAFDDSIYQDYGLDRCFDVSYIGQLGPRCVTEMYWPYMRELARYGKKAMLCIDRPMGIPLLPKPLEKFIRSKKNRSFLQKLPVWKCGWQTPKNEKDKAIIINKSKIHFGLLRVRGDWEGRVKTLLPNYPLDKHGLFYQFKGRLFQAVGAGAMALNEYCPELEDMFDIGKEIVTFEFGNPEEIRDKLRWYIQNDSERRQIAKAGYERGRKQHTFAARVRQIFNAIREKL